MEPDKLGYAARGGFSVVKNIEGLMEVRRSWRCAGITMIHEWPYLPSPFHAFPSNGYSFLKGNDLLCGPQNR